MILAVDIGNTTIEIGCIKDEDILFTESIATVKERTELEYAVIFHTLLELYKLDKESFSGAVIASEVPPLTDIFKRAVRKYFGLEAMVVGPGVKNGLNIRMDNPAQVGAGVIVNAVAGLKEYGAPLIIIDMGTATTISVIDDKKVFTGGIILPGAIVSLEALVGSTSQLQRISLEAPKSVIGKNTIDSMKSGAVYGQAAALDGMIDRIEAELHMECPVVATGSVADRIIPECRHKIIIDNSLPLKGLGLIYHKNI